MASTGAFSFARGVASEALATVVRGWRDLLSLLWIPICLGFALSLAGGFLGPVADGIGGALNSACYAIGMVGALRYLLLGTRASVPLRLGRPELSFMAAFLVFLALPGLAILAIAYVLLIGLVMWGQAFGIEMIGPIASFTGAQATFFVPVLVAAGIAVAGVFSRLVMVLPLAALGEGLRPGRALKLSRGRGLSVALSGALVFGLLIGLLAPLTLAALGLKTLIAQGALPGTAIFLSLVIYMPFLLFSAALETATLAVLYRHLIALEREEASPGGGEVPVAV